MARTVHVRDRIIGGGSEVIRRRTAEGWRMSVIEWERDASDDAEDKTLQPVPYGLRIAADCHHLEPDPDESEVLTLILGMVVREFRLPAIAQALNDRGHKTREAESWTPVAVFQLMPRLIDSGPGIFARPDWPEKRAVTV